MEFPWEKEKGLDCSRKKSIRQNYFGFSKDPKAWCDICEVHCDKDCAVYPILTEISLIS